MSRRTPLQIVEDLATEVIGRGASVSIDRVSGCSHAATAWDAKGMRAATGLGHSKAEAIRALRRDLKGLVQS